MKECSGPIDQSILSTILMLRKAGKPDPLERIVNVFISYSADLIGYMEDAIHQDDSKAIQNTAHTLKSSSGNIGALRLSTLCRDLEAAGEKGSMEEARLLVADIRREHQCVKDALAEYLKTHGI
ncbi:MAG: Hpt domain-containing protein [Deltaproteobacteria bacterium]|jgi:HPt (histidine-containing phosphotransfer) domain-containing protein|nr:Hpt domain-containing protein [Deltaproteobacteria bacterium]